MTMWAWPLSGSPYYVTHIDKHGKYRVQFSAADHGFRCNRQGFRQDFLRGYAREGKLPGGLGGVPPRPEKKEILKCQKRILAIVDYQFVGNLFFNVSPVYWAYMHSPSCIFYSNNNLILARE